MIWYNIYFSKCTYGITIWTSRVEIKRVPFLFCLPTRTNLLEPETDLRLYQHWMYTVLVFICRILSCLILSYLVWSFLYPYLIFRVNLNLNSIFSSLILSHLISSYLICSYFILSYLILSYLSFFSCWNLILRVSYLISSYISYLYRKASGFYLFIQLYIDHHLFIYFSIGLTSYTILSYLFYPHTLQHSTTIYCIHSITFILYYIIFDLIGLRMISPTHIDTNESRCGKDFGGLSKRNHPYAKHIKTCTYLSYLPTKHMWVTENTTTRKSIVFWDGQTCRVFMRSFLGRNGMPIEGGAQSRVAML